MKPLNRAEGSWGYGEPVEGVGKKPFGVVLCTRP